MPHNENGLQTSTEEHTFKFLLVCILKVGSPASLGRVKMAHILTQLHFEAVNLHMLSMQPTLNCIMHTNFADEIVRMSCLQCMSGMHMEDIHHMSDEV